MTNGALAYAGIPVQAKTRPAFERILFTTDFSETSLKALPTAAAIARTFGSTLTLMYVLTPGDEVCTVPEFTYDVKGIVERDANERLANLKYSDQLQDVNVRTEVYRGGLDTLSHKIAMDEIDLVVLATHGNKGFRHLLLGSVAEDIIHSAGSPVLTVGPHTGHTDASEFRPKHILFATDASSDSFRALPYALDFAKAQSADLAVVHVLQSRIKTSSEADAFAALMRESLYHTLPLTTIKNCRPEIVVCFGNPAEEILDAAQERHTDLILMGARSSTKRPTFSRSVSYGVISRATCPVLTVRGTR